MNKLLEQLVKFGLVGAFCFVIDFAITMAVSKLCLRIGIATDVSAVIGGFWGFVISVIVNYILSMKYVFKRRDDMNRKKEFIIFVVLSTVGLGINEILIMLGVRLGENIIPKLYDKSPETIIAASKIIATGVVMVYNFVTRKIFLEKKEKCETESEQ